MPGAKSGKKNRKYDRDRKRHIAHLRYNAERRDIKNKIRKLGRHVARWAGDRVAEACLKALVK